MSSHVKYEYRVLEYNNTLDLQHEMNELGAQGWMLDGSISVVKDPILSILVYTVVMVREDYVDEPIKTLGEMTDEPLAGIHLPGIR